MLKKLLKFSILAILVFLCVWVVRTNVSDASISDEKSKSLALSEGTIAITSNEENPEVLSKRTATSKTYKLPNKKYKSKIYGAPIHYLEKGFWKDIDLAIKRSARKGFYYENVSNTIHSFFPKRLSKENKIKFQNNQDFYHLGNSFLFSLEEDPTKGSKEVKYAVNLNNAKVQQVSSNGVKYDNENSLGYVSYDVDYNSVKQKFILKELPKEVYDASEKYFTMTETIDLPKGWGISADGRTVVNTLSTKSQLVIKNAANEVAFVIPLPEIYEEENPQNILHPSGEMEHSFTVSKKGDSYDIKVAISREWLTAEERSFPVVIDPTSNINGNWGGWLDDATGVVESNPSIFVFTGLLGTDHRSWVQFDVSSIADGATVNSIVYEAFLNNASGGGTQTVDVNNVTGALGPYGSDNPAAFTDFGDGNYASFSATATTGAYSNIILGGTANDDLENRLAGDIFQLAMSITSPNDWKRFTSNLCNIEVMWDPIPSITSTVTNPTNVSPWPMTVTFPEAMTGFEESDLMISNGTVTDFSTSDNTVFTFNLTPNSEAQVTVDVPATVAVGNVSTNPNPAAIQFAATYDATAPSINSNVPLDNATDVSITDNITITFDENVVFGTGNIEVIDVTNGTNSFTIDAASPGVQASISGAVLTLDPSSDLSDSSNYAIQIATTAIQDPAGNNFAGITDSSTLDFTTVDLTGPSVIEVLSASGNGTYGIDDVVDVSITFTEAVNVTGSPRILLETGTTDRYATYSSGNGTATLSFSYTVVAGDESADLDYVGTTSLELNSGTLQDAAGNDATLTLATPGALGSLGHGMDIVINTSVPVVTTADALNVEQLSATLGGNVTNQGGSAVTESGIVYALTSDDADPEIGDANVTKVAIGTGLGAFTQPITGFTASSAYSYKAYATNSSGTSYGSVKTFSTLALIAPTITFDDINKTYGDADFSLGATSNSAGTISYSIVAGGTGSASLSGANNATVNVGNAGTVTIRATQEADDIYTAATKDITLTIEKAILVVTANNTTIEYGDSFSIGFEYGEFKNGDDASVLDVVAYVFIVELPPYNAGTYTIRPDALSDNNYTPNYVDGTLTVNKATLTVTADDQSKTYGDANPSFTVSYSGFKNNEDTSVLDTAPTTSSVADLTTSVGTSAIVSSGGSDNNYDFNYVNGTLTISERPITVTADDKTKERTTADPVFTYMITSGDLVNGDVFTGDLTRDAGEDVGTYAINQGTLSAGANYNLTFVPGMLTIEDTIAPSAPILTHVSDYTCSGTDITGDTTLEISGTAEEGSEIEVFENGTSIGVTTTSSNGTFTFDHTGTTLADGTYNFTVTATDASNNTSDVSTPLTITIDSLDTDNDGIPDVCDDDYDGNGVTDTEEDCDGDGIVDHLDTDNSACASAITQTRSYGFSPNGDGVNDGWYIENITAYPNSVVQVYSRSGKLVFKKKGYQNDWEGVSNQISTSSNRLPVGPYIFIIDLGDGSRPTRGWIYINY